MSGTLRLSAVLAFQLLISLLPNTVLAQQVTSFLIINADTDQPVATLVDGATLDFSTIGTRNLNITAVTLPTVIGSVKFGLDGKSKYRVDNNNPYSLAGDTRGDFAAWTPTLGAHTVSATPYSEKKATGTAGATVKVAFNVIDSTAPRVTSFLLVNADNDQLIGPLSDASIINLEQLPTRSLNVVAVTEPATVGSVRFTLDGSSAISADSVAPYTLTGDVAGDFQPWTPLVGKHLLSATAYASADASTGAGVSLSIQIQVTDLPGLRTTTFPGSNWNLVEPYLVGLDSTKLERFRDYVQGRGIVVRDGEQAYAWGDISTRSDFASATKSIHTHMLLNALQNGLISGMDDPAVAFEPRLNSLNAGLVYKDRSITWRHMANMISCYGVTDMPGTTFDYSDYNIALYIDTLVENVYGVSWANADEYLLTPVLGTRIGWQDQATYIGESNNPGRIYISVRDMARFGLLYLNGGNWNGEQLLGSEFVQMATQSPLSNAIPRTLAYDAEMIVSQRTIGGGKNQSDHNGSYSFTWWTNGIMRDGSRYWPALPTDAFAAHGHWGRRVLLVVPSLQLVVAWNDASRVDTVPELREAFRLLMDAVQPQN